MYYGGFTYTEARFLPINLRRFFINEVGKELKKQNGQGEDKEDRPLSDQEKQVMKSRLQQVNPEAHRTPKEGPISESRAPHQNTPDIRALQGKERTNVPTRLLRFQGP